MKIITFLCLILLFHSEKSFSYELHIIQGVSKTGQTFVTRSGKKDGVVLGKLSTFTADNISLIAKAITVTREFTQWEVENNTAQLPFRKGQLVTVYDTTEHLWALTPEKVKTKFIKSSLYNPRKSFAFHTSFMRGLSESVSGVESQDIERGGIQLEGYIENEFNLNFALAFGLRYTTETVNVNEASLTSNRFLGIVEARYYFNPIRSFYGARPMIGIGLGYGQSATEADGLTSAGTALILPITKVGLSLPLSKKTEFSFEAAFESIEINEEFEEGTNQTTTASNIKTGIAIKRFFQ
jgi:hypothetical protein